MKVSFIHQGALKNIQGLLWHIQGFFTDIPQFFNFQGLFKDMIVFQGLFKARANYVLLSHALPSELVLLQKGSQ